MILDVAFTPAEARRGQGAVCIVVDVLRASSSIVTLFESGCREVLVAASVAEARRLAHGGRLLAGERDGLPPAGFDFGNSPAEFAATDLSGRTIVLTTSNGTAALRQVAASPAVLVGCFRNAAACCREAVARAAELRAGLQIVCAGRRNPGTPAASRSRSLVLDDAACAGCLAQTALELLAGRQDGPALTDAAWAAIKLWKSFGEPLAAFRASASGRRVAEIGQEADLAFCAAVNASVIVPILQPGQPLRLITAPPRSGP